MKRHAVWFSAPYQVVVKEEELTAPGPGEVIVRSLVSAISPGTEMLFFRGEIPVGMPGDATISVLSAPASYPMKYGYCMVGQVVELGAGVNSDWLGKRVFSFQPHQSFFSATIDSLMPLPEDISLEDAVFLPNMETAVNFIQDGAPLIGEVVLVFGQGIVGLLTVSLLKFFPLAKIIAFDRFSLRRQAAMRCGASFCIDPCDREVRKQLPDLLPNGADLVYELSGSTAALNQAISLAGFHSRVVIGSWYGNKPVELDFGGAFHRSRIRLISSQVSSLDPGLTGRWDKNRRFSLAWDMLRRIHPTQFITHRFHYLQARDAYHLVYSSPGETIQVLLEYA